MAFGWGDHPDGAILVMEILKYQELDCMLGHKHIGFENGEKSDKASYCWEKMLEYGRAWTWVIHMRLEHEDDGMTVDEQRHTVRQKYR